MSNTPADLANRWPQEPAFTLCPVEQIDEHIPKETEGACVLLCKVEANRYEVIFVHPNPCMAFLRDEIPQLIEKFRGFKITHAAFRLTERMVAQSESREWIHAKVEALRLIEKYHPPVNDRL